MPKVYKCQTARSKIANLKVLDNTLLAYNTKLHGTIILDLNECETKINITNKHLNSNVTAYSFSPNSKMLAFVNKRIIYIIDMQTKSTLQTIQTIDEDIEILSFDSSSTYLIAGSKNGRVLQYKHNKTSLLSRLCSFPHNRSDIHQDIKENSNFVSAFASYKNMFASAGYGGAIFVIDLHSQAKKYVITHRRERIDALCFIDENTIISGNNNGNIDITSLNNIKTYNSINTTLSKIKQIILMPNPDYIVVTGVTNIVAIVDIKNYKVVHNKYVEFESNIANIDIANGESLVASLDNDKIVTVELPSVSKLKSLIVHNSLEDAYKLIRTEPMLQGSFEHKMLERRFENDFLNATKALINQNKTKATQLLSVYAKVQSKQDEIKNLFEAFKSFNRFHSLFLEKKYALAYAIASKYPPLKYTAQYKKMEQVFKVAFANAQRHIQQGNIVDAKALLFEYNTVISKQPIIKLILNQNKEFVKFLAAVQKKDFLTIDKLINVNALFKQIPNYIALTQEIENKLEDIKFSIKSGEIVVAKKLIASIEEVSFIKDQIEILYYECRKMLLLQQAYEANNFKSCYEILDSHKSLSSTELGILLEKHWLKLINKCEEYALCGNLKDIKKTLGNLLSLSTRRNKIGDLIRVSFHVRIKILIQTKNFQGAETIIYSYIDIFGIDSEISQIMKKFEKTSSTKLAITQTNNSRPSRDSWRRSDIIMK